MENFAQASERNTDEAEGRGVIPFTSYDYVHDLVSVPSLGLELVLELWSGLVSGLGSGSRQMVVQRLH